MYTLSFEIQPTEHGEAVSWKWFRFHKIVPPSPAENRFGLTVCLTDAVSAILKAAKAVDPGCRVSLDQFSGFLFPDFTIGVMSEKFQIAAEKTFSGGASKENVFNYRVNLTLRSCSQTTLKLLHNYYKEIGPKPLKECFECEA